MTTDARRIAVIGGGVAGLATAALLASRGEHVELFEATDALGGRAGSWEQDGFRFDTGPSWYLMPEVFDHFFALLGTTTAEQLDLVTLDPAYRVQPEGEAAFDVRSGEDRVAALFDEIEPGSGDRLRRHLASAGDAYGLAVSRFLYDTYESTAGLRDPAVVRRAPELLGLLTRPLAGQVEKVVEDHRLRQVLGYPAVFLGGSPYEVPSLYHLMSHLDLGDAVRYPQGGFTMLVEALHRLALAHGATVTTGAEVTRIETRGDEVAGLRVRRDGREEFVAADIVVSGGDLHRTETTLLPPSQQTYPEKWWRKRTAGPGALLLLLGVEGELPELAHHTLLFARDWKASFDDVFGPNQRIPDPASIYVCRPSATDASVAPAGHENLFVLVPVPADPGIGRGGVGGSGDAAVEAAADRIIAQIADWTGVPDLADRVVVRRTIAPGDFAADLGTWRGNALGLAHTLRQSGPLRAKNVSRRVRNLYYAGADVLPGIGLPLCLISAELVVKRIAGDRTPGRLAEPATATTGENAPDPGRI